jgi:hypothetical protein
MLGLAVNVPAAEGLKEAGGIGCRRLYGGRRLRLLMSRASLRVLMVRPYCEG